MTALNEMDTLKSTYQSAYPSKIVLLPFCRRTEDFYQLQCSFASVECFFPTDFLLVSRTPLDIQVNSKETLAHSEHILEKLNASFTKSLQFPHMHWSLQRKTA